MRRTHIPLEIKALESEIIKEATERGIGLGDAVKIITDYFKIPQCARCQERQVRWNTIRLRFPSVIPWDEVFNADSSSRG